MKLDIGGGRRPAPGFVSYDLIDMNVGNDHIAGDARDLGGFVDCEIEEIRAVDVLEHISYRETDSALAEWCRVLQHGGPIYVQVPDAAEIMRRYVAREHEALRTPDGLPDTLLAGAAWRLLGGHNDGRYSREGDDWRLNAHYSMWDAWTLREAMYRAGFTEVAIDGNTHPNLLCTAVKP